MASQKISALTAATTLADTDLLTAVIDPGGTPLNRKITVASLKTLLFTSPKIITSILDTNGNEVFVITATASAVNELTVSNAATGNNPNIAASGGDSNIGITLTPKGNKDAAIVGGIKVADFGNDGKMAYGFTTSPNSGLWWQMDSGETGTLHLRNAGTDRLSVSATLAAFNVPVRASEYRDTGGTKVVGTQGAAVADSTGILLDLTTQFNTLLARLRAHGLIAT